MICLMLDAACQKAGGFLHLLLTVDVLIADDDTCIARHLPEKARHGEATLRVRRHLIAVRLPFGIDVGFEAAFSVICDKDALGDCDLRCRKSHSVCFIQRFLHIKNQKFQFLIERSHRRCDRFQDRVSGSNNFTQNGIIPFVYKIVAGS